MSDRQSKQYNDREGQSVEWERAVTKKESIHSTFFILNILQLLTVIVSHKLSNILFGA
jgi:hypothetical protein